jgi:hypothetical protein
LKLTITVHGTAQAQQVFADGQVMTTAIQLVAQDQCGQLQQVQTQGSHLHQAVDTQWVKEPFVSMDTEKSRK